MEVKVTKVRLAELTEWFENTLSDKYDIALEGLKLRFLKFYQIIKGIIDFVLELRELIQESKYEKKNISQLINNCL